MARRSDLSPEETRAHLLAAGAQLFAEHGFHGVGLRQIAATAGVRSGMVAYHFGDKAGLHDAVISAYYDRLGEIRDAVLPRLPLPTDELARLIWDEVYARRDAVRLILRYIVDEGRLPPSPRLDGMTDEALAFVGALGAEGEQARLGLTSFLYVLSRWVLNDPDELVRVTGAESEEEAHARAARHLAACAEALLVR